VAAKNEESKLTFFASILGIAIALGSVVYSAGYQGGEIDNLKAELSAQRAKVEGMGAMRVEIDQLQTSAQKAERDRDRLTRIEVQFNATREILRNLVEK